MQCSRIYRSILLGFCRLCRLCVCSCSEFRDLARVSSAGHVWHSYATVHRFRATVLQWWLWAPSVRWVAFFMLICETGADILCGTGE